MYSRLSGILLGFHGCDERVGRDIVAGKMPLHASENDLDCAVIETLHELVVGDGRTPFDSVRCAFEEGKPAFSGSAIRDKTHVQICIRNIDCIKGYFLPLTLGGNVVCFKPKP